MNKTPDAIATTAPTPTPAQYHPAVDAVITSHLGPGPWQRELRDTPDSHPTAAAADLLDDAAFDAKLAIGRLTGKIRQAVGDLTAAAEEADSGRCAEHLITGHHDLPVIAARYTDALRHLDAAARTYAALRKAARTARPAAGRDPAAVRPANTNH